jgi:hypothetical protein
MSLQRAMQRTLSLALVLSVGLWAESGLAMLSGAGTALQCHAVMSPAHHPAAAMPCCPSRAASVPAHFFDPPPCCDVSSQQALPLALVVVSGKFRSCPLSANRAVDMTFVPLQPKSALSLIAGSPPFVKPDLDKKTDLRI